MLPAAFRLCSGWFPRQASVTLFECLVVILIVIFSDWPAYARKAQERNRLTVPRPLKRCFSWRKKRNMDKHGIFIAYHIFYIM